MKKTVTINLAGFVFHIDEDAYDRLGEYLNAVRNSVGNDESSAEIMNDIEARISELFSEKIKPGVGVVSMADVQRIIQIMGQPTDYEWNDAQQTKEQHQNTQSTVHASTKKMYRDGEERILGGVLAGFSHYFGIDPVWFRILFCILFFGFGVGLMIYIVLWIIIPKAKTTAEKLEMKREAVTVDSIKNSVDESIQNVKKYGRTHGNTIAFLIKRFIGFGFIFLGFLGILGALLTPIAISQINHIYVNDNQLMQVIYTNLPRWSVLTSLFFIIFCPACLMLTIALKLIYNNIKHLRWISFSLIILWILSIAYFVFAIIKSETEGDKILNSIFQENYTTTKQSFDIPMPANDTLFINFINDPKMSYINAGIDREKDKYLENRNVKLSIQESNSDKVYYEVETRTFSNPEAEIRFLGKSKTVHLTDVPYTLDYFHEVNGKQFVLSNAFLETTFNDDFIENSVQITLYVPANLHFSLNSDNIQHFSNKKHVEKGTHIYQFQHQQLTCSNC